MDDFEIFRKLANCQDKEQMARVIEEYNVQNKPMTNADRIRAESDEELAGWLIFWRDDWGDYYTPAGFYDEYEEALEETIKWLQQPAKENEP